MTVKEASVCFKKSEREIRKLIKDGYILDFNKNGKRYDIGDDVKVILSKNEVKYVLKTLLLLKNNNDIPLSVKIFENDDNTIAIMTLLDRLGFVATGKNITKGFKDILLSYMITDAGFNLLFSKAINSAENSIILNIKNTVNINLGIVNVAS